MFNLNSSPEISGLLLKISCTTHEVLKHIVCNDFGIDIANMTRMTKI